MNTFELISELRALCDKNTGDIEKLREMIRKLNHCPDCELELKSPEGEFGGYSRDLCKC